MTAPDPSAPWKGGPSSPPGVPDVVTLSCCPGGILDSDDRNAFSDWCRAMLGVESQWVERPRFAANQRPLMLVTCSAWTARAIREIADTMPFGMPFDVVRVEALP